MHKVYITYKKYNSKIDKDLENMGKQYSAFFAGSGYSLVTFNRSLHFEFNNKRNADNFRKAANRYLKRITG